jgi:uncharacterized protein YkvS
MNIIELANELQGLGKDVYDNPLLVDAANMLRSQATQIAELEKFINSNQSRAEDFWVWQSIQH